MPPSYVRKEEAELRQIAKQSRLARKEAQVRERKQRQREMRKAATAGGAEAGAAAVPSSASSSTPRKRQAAIILPSEVQELHQRLSGATSDSSPSTSPKKQASGAKKGKKSAARPAASATAAASSTLSFPEPNHRLEIHYKKKAVLVDVMLHHIPHQKIDVSESTATTLVVDTTKHTKKMRLELPMPEGVSVVMAKAEFELEGGVLRCTLPIAGEEVPAELQEKWDTMIQSIREQKALRFRMTKDGDLTVRTRQALLAADTQAQAAFHKVEVEKRAAKRGRAVMEEPVAEEAESDEDEEASEGEAVEKAPARQIKSLAPVKKKAKKDALKEEHARAVELAKAAAEQASSTIRARVQLAKEVQQKRNDRVQVRSSRKDEKAEKRQASFQRVLEEQRRQLLERATQQAEGQRAERRRSEAKRAGVPSKTVSFAE